jgi:GNAT superfamily N-acetyltransferase
MCVVRRAGAADIEELLVLVREFCDLDRHDFDRGRVCRALLPLLADDAVGQVWLLAEGASAVGYTVVTWGWSLESGGREALLDEVYLRRRGGGLGRVLLGHAMSAAALAGASRMFLETEAHNARVRAFYAGLGFTVEDSVWMSGELSPPP